MYNNQRVNSFSGRQGGVNYHFSHLNHNSIIHLIQGLHKMKKLQDYYVYTHSTEKHGIFYVGKGNERRITSIPRPRNPHHTNIVKKYGKENIIVKTMLCRSEQHALDLEVRMIAALRNGGVKLVNMTDGGEGVSGHKKSKETLRKIAKTMSTPEYKARQSAILKLVKSTPEYKEKVALTRSSKEYKEKISAMHLRPEYRAKQSETRNTPEFKEKMNAIRSSKEYIEKCASSRSTIEHKIKHSSAIKIAMAKPECKEKHLKAIHSPEYRKKFLASISTPEARKRKSEIMKVITNTHEYRNARMLIISTPEYKAKVAATISTPEHKAKVAAIKANPEYKLRQSMASKLSWEKRKMEFPEKWNKQKKEKVIKVKTAKQKIQLSAEEIEDKKIKRREFLSTLMKGRKHSTETKAKMSESQKERYKNKNDGIRTKNNSDNTSGYKGVCWHKGTNSWVATITIDRKRKWIGSFKTALDAHQSWLSAFKNHYGFDFKAE